MEADNFYFHYKLKISEQNQKNNKTHRESKK